MIYKICGLETVPAAGALMKIYPQRTKKLAENSDRQRSGTAAHICLSPPISSSELSHIMSVHISRLA